MIVGSDDLPVGGFMLLFGAFTIPWSSVGFALSFHLLDEHYLPHVVGFWAERNNPDHPGTVLGWLLTRNRHSGGPHPNHLYAGAENVILFAVANGFALVMNLPFSNPYYTPGLLLRLFTVAFFACEALWLRWFYRFVLENRRRPSDQTAGSSPARWSDPRGQVADHHGLAGDSSPIWSDQTDKPD